MRLKCHLRSNAVIHQELHIGVHVVLTGLDFQASDNLSHPEPGSQPGISRAGRGLPARQTRHTRVATRRATLPDTNMTGPSTGWSMADGHGKAQG